MSGRESQKAAIGDAFRGKNKKDDNIGDYQSYLTPDMAGNSSVDLSYKGPQGPAKLKVPVNIKQQDVLCLQAVKNFHFSLQWLKRKSIETSVQLGKQILRKTRFRQAVGVAFIFIWGREVLQPLVRRCKYSDS
jgi:hypothetical protein